MQRTHIAGLLVTSGIADALDGESRQPADIALELNLDPDVTRRVLEAATASRLARMNRAGNVKLSRIGRPLRTDDPHSIAAWVAHHTIPPSISAYAELPALLKNGAEPSGYRRAIGESLWEYLAKNPESGAEFSLAMRQLTAIDIQAMVRAYPWPRRGVICDVGGGAGDYLAAILERRPHARGVLVESPGVLAGAAKAFDRQGLANRVELIPGDLFEDVQSSADVYILKWILHNWSDETCLEILSRLRATMPHGSRLIVVDQHLEPNRPNAATSLTDLHMLVACEGGRERSPSHIHRLMTTAGLRPGRVRHAGLHMLVEGIAPSSPN